MGNPATGTLTRTVSITLTDVRHVLWRIQTDLRVLRVQHGFISEEFEREVAEDLLLFIYRNYVQEIELRFVDPSTNTRKYGVRYELTRTWTADQDDEAGGIRYQDLTGTNFTIVVKYSPAWRGLSSDQQAAFKQSLKRRWGPVADVLDGVGAWVTDRAYGSGGLGATRAVYRSY